MDEYGAATGACTSAILRCWLATDEHGSVAVISDPDGTHTNYNTYDEYVYQVTEMRSAAISSVMAILSVIDGATLLLYENFLLLHNSRLPIPEIGAKSYIKSFQGVFYVSREQATLNAAILIGFFILTVGFILFATLASRDKQKK